MSHDGLNAAFQRLTVEKMKCDLETSGASVRDLINAVLTAISVHPDGPRIFPHGPDSRAPDRADRVDALRREGRDLALGGIPISIKDNIAQRGVPLCAGSRFLKNDGPARNDAEVVSRLEAAGAVIVGRTNMTELAFSGLGINPHYGTPPNPAAPLCAPGGSSSGAAASVAAGLAAAAIGTDTSGSCRIPAAFCNIVGFKPTAHRISQNGVFPLSHSLDSVGILARSVDCCATIDAVLADDGARAPARPSAAGLKLADLTEALGMDSDPAVTTACAAAIERLRSAGVGIETLAMDVLPRVRTINREGGFGSVELFHHLQERLSGIEGLMDPRVLRRIRKGESISDDSYRTMRNLRAELIDSARAQLDCYDAVLMPTVAIAPPQLSDLEADEDFDRINLLALRNAGIANLLDRCAVTIPCTQKQGVPVGLTLMGRHGDDRALLAIASVLEPLIRDDRG